MIHVNPYLNFNGKTEEAFNFYASVFKSKLGDIYRFKDTPQTEANRPPDSEGNRVMHASLPIGDHTVLMGSDISDAMGMKLIEGNNNYISLHPDSLDEAKRIYSELSANGVVEMPLEKMFWGAYFASFADKFGVRWMINFEEKK